MSPVAATSTSSILRAVVSATVVDKDQGHERAGPSAHAEYDHHEQIELPAHEAPTLALGLREFGHRGYALSLETTRFSFTPDHADGPHVPGKGHAHLYIDGRKIARIYSPHHPLEPFSPESREINVILVRNDHRVDATGGGVGLHYILWEPHDRPAPKPPERLPFSIRDGKLASNNKIVKVAQNDRVVLQLSADNPIPLRMHGYDVEVTVTPDFPVTLHFIAGIPGRFAIDKHSGDEMRHSALAQIEVFPD